ncbi:restriction endonuclease subunit S [Enterobacter sp. Ap-1006]|uniref:restriction endonuclease subunit S n=1 Tax=Enterobacter sp. Ap-1006 TaxID=2608345 RepID=UPI00142307EA|nr:restriction endonuclease subunit S [Enterobacter sp. Ap-1006]NIF47731.1 restriction endonuclease subunit S [Enterobacter sp. Ap-1006]
MGKVLEGLPEGWVHTTLGEIVELKYGKSLPTQSRDGGIYPVYGSNGVVGGHSAPLVTSTGLIVGRKGSYGEVNISHLPFFPIDTTYFVDEFYDQPANYWFYQLKHLPLDQLNRSTAIPGLNRDDAYAQEILFPSINEQKKIVEKLDLLLAPVESIKTRLDNVFAILKLFRQAVLSAALSGSLTHVNKLKVQKLGTLVEIISGIAFKKSQYSSEGSKLMQITNVGYGETRWDKRTCIDFSLADEYCDYSLLADDIVLALNRPITNNLLKVALITLEDLPSTLYQRVARLRVLDTSGNDIFPQYIYFIMQSNEFKKVVEDNLQGSDQPYLNTSVLPGFDIVFPDLDEQKKIIVHIEKLFGWADNIEKQVAEAQKRVNNLTQSILAKAFRGELTEQWRKDNPELISGENSAAALLERIKAERQVTTPKRKTKAKKQGA